MTLIEVDRQYSKLLFTYSGRKPTERDVQSKAMMYCAPDGTVTLEANEIPIGRLLEVRDDGTVVVLA